MSKLSEIEADSQLDVPREAGRALKAFAEGAANEYQQQLAYRFILEVLCGVDRLSFVPGRENPADLMIWREGRRFVGQQLRRIVATPMTDEPEPEPPPPRTITERVRRREKRQAQQPES